VVADGHADPRPPVADPGDDDRHTETVAWRAGGRSYATLSPGNRHVTDMRSTVGHLPPAPPRTSAPAPDLTLTIVSQDAAEHSRPEITQ